MIESKTENAVASPAAAIRCGAGAEERNLSRMQKRAVGYAAYLATLTLLFVQPLTRLMLYAARSDLHSHILLVPFIACYLLYIRSRQLPAAYRSSIAMAIILGA